MPEGPLVFGNPTSTLIPSRSVLMVDELDHHLAPACIIPRMISRSFRFFLDPMLQSYRSDSLIANAASQVDRIGTQSSSHISPRHLLAGSSNYRSVIRATNFSTTVLKTFWIRLGCDLNELRTTFRKEQYKNIREWLRRRSVTLYGLFWIHARKLLAIS